MNESQRITLGEVCEFILDGTHGSPERTQSGVPVLSAQNVTGGSLSFDTDRFTTQAEYERYAKRLTTRQGDVLLTIVGTIGRTGLLQSNRSFVFQRSVAVLRVKPSVCDNRYLYHSLNSSDVRIQLEQRTNQSSQAGVYLSKLKTVEIPLPPLAEQRRIADILDKADHLRQLRRAVLVKLNTLLQSIFLDLFGDPVTNPKRWPKYSLNELVRKGDRINYGVVQPGGDFPNGVPLIRVGDFAEGSVKTEDVKRIDPEIESKYARSRLRGDEILISCVGSIGHVFVVDQSHKGFNIARAVARVPLCDDVNRHFVAQHIKTQAIQAYFNQETRTVSQPTLNIKQIREAELCLPPVEKQDYFAKASSQVRELERHVQQHERKLDQLFSSLQQCAFRGDF